MKKKKPLVNFKSKIKGKNISVFAVYLKTKQKLIKAIYLKIKYMRIYFKLLLKEMRGNIIWFLY